MIEAPKILWPGGVGVLISLSIFIAPGAVWAQDPKPAGTYVLQLNAYKIESNAHSFVQKYEAKGYPVYLEHGEGEPWHRVKMGPFPSWEKAKKPAH